MWIDVKGCPSYPRRRLCRTVGNLHLHGILIEKYVYKMHRKSSIENHAKRVTEITSERKS